MNYCEEALNFSCQGESLLGILSVPDQARTLGVIVVVGGPQYRVGSHRQFVSMARFLASAGFPVMRFDHRGIGDSTGQNPGFEAIGEDIHAALQALQARVPQLSGVVLWGLCDAASASLLYCQNHRDQRIKGLALANPWVRSPESLARAHVKHYYLDRLKQNSFWRKLLRGQLSPGAWRGLLSNVRTALLQSRDPMIHSFQRQMAQAFLQFQGPILLTLSELDYTAKEFLEVTNSQPVWQQAMKRQDLTRIKIPLADHTFSNRAARETLESATLNWLHAVSGQSRSLSKAATEGLS